MHRACCAVLWRAGPAKVTQLLYNAFMQLKAKKHYQGPSTAVLQTLTGLPGAAGITFDCFAVLFELCVLKKDGSKLGPLLQLPCLQELDSEQLCGLIRVAGKEGFLDLIPQLCRWVDTT